MLSDEQARAESALARYRAGKQHTKPGELPGGGAFVWRVLTGAENQACLAAAIEHFEKMKIPAELRAYSDLEDETFWQILFRAMRDPGDVSKTLAKSVDELRQLLDSDERDILAQQYLDFKSEVNPQPSELSPATFAAIRAAVQKKSVQALSDFEPYMLRLYLLTSDNQPSS